MLCQVRWQAAKQPAGAKIKRYKLNLIDVMFVEVGKQVGHFQDVEVSRVVEGPSRDVDGWL
jgi:hypothetical protein